MDDSEYETDTGTATKQAVSDAARKIRNGEKGVIIHSRYYYKCETADCVMEGKSAKAKYVIDTAQSFLLDHFFVTTSNYDVFIDNAKLQIKQSQRKMDSAIAKLKADIINKERSYERIKKLLEEDGTGKLKTHYDLDQTFDELKKMKERCTKAIAMRKDVPVHFRHLKNISNSSSPPLIFWVKYVI